MSESESEFNMDSKFLEDMLNKALKSAQNDVEEAQKHVDQIKKEIEKNPESTRSLHTFAIMYQEALKVKGIARDRHLKIVRMIQDRVRILETAKSTKGGSAWMITPEAIQEMLDRKDAGDE